MHILSVSFYFSSLLTVPIVFFLGPSAPIF
jgi:hypothetical protein